MIVYLVVNGQVLAGYEYQHHAAAHALTVTGARVVMLEIQERLPNPVLEDIGSDDWEESMTPVEAVPSPDSMTPTKPTSVRAVLKAAAQDLTVNSIGTCRLCGYEGPGPLHACLPDS